MLLRASRLGSVALATSLIACAHQGSSAPAQQPDPVQDELSRLRKEHSAMRRRMEMLEDRMLQFERVGAQDRGPSLPVVKLDAGPSNESETRARQAHLRPRRSISLESSPQPDPAIGHAVGTSWEAPDDRGREVESDGSDSATMGHESASASASATKTRSFRLVGDRLVELTKKNAPTRPDRPERGRRGDAILGEYEAAMALYRAGDFPSAETAFERFARSYGRHDYADNALYWKGEAAYDQRHYADALAAFTEVVERYGGGNKAADALLKIGLCYRQLGDEANANDVLTQLVAAYPRAKASDIARAKLTEPRD